ncbi:MAG: DNA-directed RNA polymerase subunit alpha [Chloroflexi bacterium]|nr:DNA-directed RNA polymerase subunit alpha [Chloroflexota bacterium]
MVTPQIHCEELTEEYGRFVAEPLESGYGTTLGNALRRVLLSSLPGAAVTWVRIDGVQHEFSTIPHVKEDTIEFLLNVKELRLRPLSDRPGRMFLEVSGEGEVTAGDIRPTADFEVVNPESHLATLDSAEARLMVEFNVEQGKGYIPAGPGNGLPIGVIPVDAIFTPVRRVNYRVESTRVGQKINYDRLILEVWTDGTKSPTGSVAESAQMLMEQLAHFAHIGQEAAAEIPGIVPVAALTGGRYDMPIEELGLTVRAYNALKRNNVTKVGQLLALSDDELLHIRNFGDKSLTELRERLEANGFLKPEAAEEQPPAEEVQPEAEEAEDAEAASGS